jgi:hypothetical protein
MEQYMKPRVIDAQCQNNYKILLTFTNNEQRILDISPFLSLGVFQKLKDSDEFKQVKVGFGTIEWPCGADLDPEFVWDKSVPVDKESVHYPLTQA